ncbi:uncharacterized protein LOC132314010 [Cornus florida]|uniref:uncharacterized protein LOC132314010 n=1 Tax=Cornus florida TaxID=4283 RepID=UPI00289D50F8|nr:uncharacterized protein LOC132314010 [Cornus florida]
MALKMDLRKAYDSVSWDFIRKTLQLYGFSATWIKWIMQCVTSSKFSVLCNGVPTGFFAAGRGIRQGCPLFPLLFTLITDYFSTLMHQKILGGQIKLCNLVQKTSLLVSHAFYADYLFIIVKADISIAKSIDKVLKRFHEVTSLTVNKDKSSVIFSKAVRGKRRILQVLQMKNEAFSIKYLGITLENRALKAVDCKGLFDKVNARVDHWNTINLSLAGLSLVQRFGANMFGNFDKQATARALFAYGVWLFPPFFSEEAVDFIANINLKAGEDEISWISGDFSLKNAWSACRTRGQVILRRFLKRLKVVSEMKKKSPILKRLKVDELKSPSIVRNLFPILKPYETQKNEEFKLKDGWHRCTLSEFIEVVSNLNEEKRKNVEDIGFGNMLNLKCSFLSTKLFNYFVESFDGQKCRIRLQEENVYLPINAIDVQSILGIPAGIIPVPICKNIDSDWVDEGGYRNDKEMHVDQLMDRVKNLEAGKDFKRAFVLFVCAAVPSPNG